MAETPFSAPPQESASAKKSETTTPRVGEPWKVLGIWAAMGSAILLAWGVWIAYAHECIGRKAIAFSGTWGDAFAPVTGLFSAITLGFAFWTLKEQREELAAQRMELAAQSKLIGEQLAALEASKKALEEQRAEMTNHVAEVREANRIARLRAEIDATIALTYWKLSTIEAWKGPGGSDVQPKMQELLKEVSPHFLEALDELKSPR